MKISILTPSFNNFNSIEHAIRSVKDQGLDGYEHIIVDGASTDGTVSVLNKHDHLKWVSEKDEGQPDAMNKAFQMCSGDIVTYLNADDYFESGVFKHVIEYFIQNPETDIVVGNLNRVYPSGEKRVQNNQAITFEDLLYRERIFPGNPVSYFYRRSLQEKIGLFPIDEHFAMDYWFILRAYYYGKVGYLDRVFGSFVMDGHNKTMVHDSSKRIREILLEFCDEFIPSAKPAVLNKLKKEDRIMFWRNLRRTIRLRTRLRKLINI